MMNSATDTMYNNSVQENAKVFNSLVPYGAYKY